MSVEIKPDGPESCLSPKEFARRAGVSKSTVDRYLRQGLLAKVQRKKGYRVWIPERELYAVMLCSQALLSSNADGSEPDGIHEEKTVNPLPGKAPAWMKGLHNTNRGGSDAENQAKG